MTAYAQPHPTARPWSLTASLRAPHIFWITLGVYLLAHILLRLWETPNIGKNDVQEALAAQGWAWGYHPRNPPLHTWLLMSSYAVFGVRLMAHVVLKYALLGLTLGLGYLCARRVMSNQIMALISAFALMLLAPFAWTVHTALTHTLLLAAVNLATLWAAMRLGDQRRTIDYALFGLVIALGFLAKYSYALFLLPLLAAMLTQPTLRRTFKDWRMWLTLAVALLVFAPHGFWMLEASFNFVQFLAEKQQNAQPQPYLLDVAHGLGALGYQALVFLAPLLLVFVPAFWGRLRTPASTQSAASAWPAVIMLTIAFSLALLVLDVLVLRAVNFELRYMMCALLLFPLAAFAWLERREPSQKALTGFVVGALAIGGIVFIALPARAVLSPASCNRCWEEMAAPELASQVRHAGFVEGTIVSDHYNVAGNMRLAFPDSEIIAANYDIVRAPVQRRGQCLLTWNARNAGDAMPDGLRQYLERRGLDPAGAPSYIDAPLRRSTRMDRFAYWIVPNADGNCRSSAANATGSS